MDSSIDGFFKIEAVLQKRREQAESVRGKNTPYRVEFSYGKGHSSYQYFTTLEDAEMATDCKCGYTVYGTPYTQRPLSQRLFERGPRGGWKRISRKEPSE